jgi:hypothetical protein
VQLTVSIKGWLTPPEQLPIFVHVFVCCPDDGQTQGDNMYVQFASVHNGVNVHDSEVAGFPPVHPHGKDEVTVLVLVPELLHSDQLVYVNEVQAEDW